MLRATRPAATTATATLIVCALAACGASSSSGGDDAQIRNTIATFTKDRTCSVLDDHARQNAAGSTDLATCDKALRSGAAPQPYTIASVTVSGSNGQADLRTTDGSRRAFLIKTGGHWLLHNVTDTSSSGTSSTDTTASAPTTGTSSGATSTTGPTGSADTSTAKVEYASAFATLNAGAKAFEARTLPDLQAGNLTAAKTDTATYRTVVFNFDRAIRAISFPSNASPDASNVLVNDMTLIANLDAAAASSSLAEYAHLIKRIVPVSTSLDTNASKLTTDLG